MPKGFITIALALALLPVSVAFAQTSLVRSDMSASTKIAPAYFGPNAFPVPEMADGRPHGSIYAETAVDYSKGNIGDGQDRTWDAFAHISIPLWTSRATIEIWMPVIEWWDFSPAVATARRLPAAGYRGHDSGDVYICTNLHLLEGCDNSWRPDILVRSVLKSASGNSFDSARYYDSPGYFFDLTAGEGFRFNSFIKEVRVALCGGFLCWQTDNGRQNDAVQGGILASAVTPFFSLTTELGAYLGWEKDGDNPVRGRLRIDIHPWKAQVHPFVQSCWGFRDYPFYSVRTGVSFNL
jgi:hypothetical protein